MVNIQSKEVIDKISDDLKVQPSMQIPRELAKLIQLVYNVNPDRLIRITNAAAADSTSATVLTTSSVKDTFIVGVELSISKDAVSDSLQAAIRGTAFGSDPFNLTTMRLEPTTAAQNLTSSNMFPFPIKMERGSAITVTSSTATASIDLFATLFFFEVDPL